MDHAYLRAVAVRNHNLVIVFDKSGYGFGCFDGGDFLLRKRGTQGVMAQGDYDSFLFHRMLPSCWLDVFGPDHGPVRQERAALCRCFLIIRSIIGL